VPVGFSDIETDGIWAVSKEAAIEAVVSEGYDGANAKLHITLSSFNPTLEDRWIEVSVVGGGSERRSVTDWEDFQFVLDLPSANNVFLRVNFNTNMLIPAGMGDPRMINVFLRSVSIQLA
jgi:hypothetical protein